MDTEIYNSVQKMRYDKWVTSNDIPIIRSFAPFAINHDNRYDYIVDVGFDILKKFMILLHDENDIHKIMEARLQIGTHFFIIKIDRKSFHALSKFCYEMNFVIDKDTMTQLMFPLVAMQYDKNISINLFIKDKLNYHPQILCEYYNIKIEARRALAQNSVNFNTNHGEVVIARGMIGMRETPYIFSYHNNENYNIIHQKLLEEYNNNLLLCGKHFTFKIKYSDIKSLAQIDVEEFDKIIGGLSLEWNVCCNKNSETEEYCLYF